MAVIDVLPTGWYPARASKRTLQRLRWVARELIGPVSPVLGETILEALEAELRRRRLVRKGGRAIPGPKPLRIDPTTISNHELSAAVGIVHPLSAVVRADPEMTEAIFVLGRFLIVLLRSRFEAIASD